MNENILRPEQDEDILALYFARDERAITETEVRYGRVCMKVSMGILASRPDAEECVNDTYLKTWQSIPPTRPQSLCAYVCRIVRNLSINRLRQMKASKRTQSLTMSLDEIAATLPAPEEADSELPRHISAFLRRENDLDRRLFMGRYWYGQSVKELASEWDLTAKTVSQKLFRTRERMRTYLYERGYHV